MAAPVHVSTHPLLKHKLAALRTASTPPYIFRGLVYEIAQVLFYEATQDVPLQKITVKTPLQECAAEQLAMKIGFARRIAAASRVAVRTLVGADENVFFKFCHGPVLEVFPSAFIVHGPG